MEGREQKDTATRQGSNISRPSPRTRQREPFKAPPDLHPAPRHRAAATRAQRRRPSSYAYAGGGGKGWGPPCRYATNSASVKVFDFVFT